MQKTPFTTGINRTRSLVSVERVKFLDLVVHRAVVTQRIPKFGNLLSRNAVRIHLNLYAEPTPERAEEGGKGLRRTWGLCRFLRRHRQRDGAAGVELGRTVCLPRAVQRALTGLNSGCLLICARPTITLVNSVLSSHCEVMRSLDDT